MSSAYPRVKLKRRSIVPYIILAVVSLIEIGLWFQFVFRGDGEPGSPAGAVQIFSHVMTVVTLIYVAIWFSTTRHQAAAGGYNDLPSSWIILIPIYGYLRLAYKHARFLEEVTAQRYNWAVPFLIGLFLGAFVMMAFSQHQYNSLTTSAIKPGTIV